MRFCPRYNIAIFVDFVVFGLCFKQKQSAILIAIGGKFPQKVGIFDASFHQRHQIYHNDGIEQSDFYNKLLKNKFILDSDILISFFPSKFLPEHLPKTKGLKFGPRLWPESRKVDTIRVGTDRVGTVRVGTVRVGTIRVGTVRVGTVRVDTVRVGTIRVGTVRVSTDRAGTDRVGTVRMATVRMGIVRVGTVRVVSQLYSVIIA